MTEHVTIPRSRRIGRVDLVEWQHPIEPIFRVICFGMGGAGAAWARPLGLHLPRAEVAVVRLPGREALLGSEPFRSLSEIVEGVIPCLTPEDARIPTVLLGNCVGAVVAWEATRELRRRRVAPTHALVLCGAPPTQILRDEPLYSSASSTLRAWLSSRGGTDARILADEKLFAVYEPAIRADFEARELFVPQDEPPLDVSAYLVGPSDDLALLEGWRPFFSHEPQIRTWSGDGTFLSSLSYVAGVVATAGVECANSVAED